MSSRTSSGIFLRGSLCRYIFLLWPKAQSTAGATPYPIAHSPNLSSVAAQRRSLVFRLTSPVPELGDGLVARNRLQGDSSLFGKLPSLENSENRGPRTGHQGDLSPQFKEFLLHLGNERVCREHGNFERVEASFGIEN